MAKKQTKEASLPQLDPQQWVEEYGDAMYYFALRRLRDGALAEEAVQEAFVSALKGGDSFEGRSSEKTWLFGILKFKVIDILRRQAKDVQPGSAEEGQEEAFDRLFNERGHWQQGVLSDWKVDPGEVAQQKDFLAALESCIEALPEKQGRAFALREIDDLDTEEVCKLLGITSTNLWVMLHRARAKLRSCLEASWFATE